MTKNLIDYLIGKGILNILKNNSSSSILPVVLYTFRHFSSILQVTLFFIICLPSVHFTERLLILVTEFFLALQRVVHRVRIRIKESCIL